MKSNKQIQFHTLDAKPAVNVCIFRNRKYIDFKIEDNVFDVMDLENNTVLAGISSDRVWRIKIKESKPAVYSYFLILDESTDMDSIRKNYEAFQKTVSNITIIDTGGDVYLGERFLTTNKKYLLLAGPFEDERTARHNSKLFGQLNHCRLHRQQVKDGSGVLEIFDSEYEISAEVKDGIRLVPHDHSAMIELEHFEIHNHNNDKRQHEQLFYPGEMTIKIDESELLAGMSSVCVEDYLKGVIHSEIGAGEPFEFVKSMAIVARSEVFARFGQKHIGELFDFCGDGHCLRYFGKRFNDPVIDRAVKETRGQVLGDNGRVCDAHFTYSCGGHTENAADVWLTSTSNFSIGKYDGNSNKKNEVDLTREEEGQKWILRRPDVYCNLVSNEPPAALKDATETFRWEVFYTRNELEQILEEKTGEQPGIIYEIIPKKRGVSGRLKEVEIFGSLKNITIKGELNIRSAFSDGLLKSSCFFVKPDVDDDGVPINFMFIGAGMGHGVGLCKVGAAMMAKDNKSADEILLHYFEKSKIIKIY
ncbi:MAG: SpoIID/LytB domain-containing protein [Calditrichaceae bacterium]